MRFDQLGIGMAVKEFLQLTVVFFDKDRAGSQQHPAVFRQGLPQRV